jgi:ubiquitin carboxyl-terminal hydrolase 47
MERVKENQFLYLKEGEYVFDLFAILIHSGGAYGGHYYAYIKDFVTG